MGLPFSKNEFHVDGRTVLITGGSKGLGLNAARQLAEKGANVIIVARDQSHLDKGIAFVSEGACSPSTQRFHTISADVTTASECSRVVTEATAWNDDVPPDVVWCCSGSSHATLFVDTPLDQFQNMMDSNYFSCVYMAHAILNIWLRPGTETREHGQDSAAQENSPTKAGGASPARHIIFTGSFVSFYSFAGFTPYSPSKAAIRSLSDSLSQEMNLYAAAHPTLPRVRVHTVFPATMPTQSLEDENRVKTDLTKSLEEGDQVLEPAECARRAIAGLESGEELVTTSIIIRLVMTSVMGGSVRGGFLKGLINTLLGWIVLAVMVFIRWEMDTKVAKWGRKHGPSGMLRKKE
ncbi:NAD(P)-binding protein [Xylariomycetidae sp. FL2044]|nr:NAD(P)-binding protein [Xylariomycetidae sp. FL2044]